MDDLITDFSDKDIPFSEKIDPNSLIIKQGYVEENMESLVGSRYQFTRNGYYTVDTESTKDKLIYNRIVSLRSSYKPKAK